MRNRVEEATLLLQIDDVLADLSPQALKEPPLLLE
jgi:hypothetical protein